MEQLKAVRHGKCCGEAVLCAGGERVEIRVTISDPGDGLYRAVLRGERGQLALGVLEPSRGRLTLCRRPCRADVEALGKLIDIETVCTFPFRKRPDWERVGQPGKLFRTQGLRERLENIGEAWIRREGDHRFLALELTDGRPFPLEMLFCMGRVRTVEGRRCVVYEFDRDEVPVNGGAREKSQKNSSV